jgi:RHS repeat-associated protein
VPGRDAGSQPLIAVHTRDPSGALHVQAFRHDTLGRVVALTESLGSDEPALQTRYHYDERGRIVRVDGPAPVGAGGGDDFGLVYRHDEQGSVVSIGRHRNGVIQPGHYASYTWGARGRLLSETRNPHSRSGRLLLQYGYDAQGRLASIKASVGGQPRYAQTLRYDGRLIGEMRQTYSDGRGVPQRLHWKRGQRDGSLNERVDERSERLLQSAGKDGVQHAYAYDRNGNVLRKTGHLERIDIDPFFNLARSLATAGGNRMQLRYGGAQLERVWQARESGPPQARSTVQQAYYRGLSEYPLLIRRDERPHDTAQPARRSLKRMVWGPTGLVAVNDDAGDGGVDRFVIGNHHTSTVMVLADDGRALASYAYTPSGRVVGSDGAPLQHEPLVPYLFQGQEYDWASGLHNYRARLYDSDTLRFLAPDPVVVPGQPAYVAMNADTVNFVDPDGRMMAHVSDLRRGVRGHMIGVAFGLVATATEVSLYYAVPFEAAFLYAAAGPVVGVIGGAYVLYVAYNWYVIPAARRPTESAMWAVVVTDQMMQGQGSGAERAWNLTYSTALAAVQVGGGKAAVAFGTPMRADWRAGVRNHPAGVYAAAYVTNTLVMQPVNGVVVLLQEAAHRRRADIHPLQQMGWMTLNDVVGNACFHGCMFLRDRQGLHADIAYRLKGCMRAWMTCRAMSRATAGVAMSAEEDWNLRISNAVPDVIFGGAVDYAVGTQIMAKLPLANVHTFLFGPDPVRPAVAEQLGDAAADDVVLEDFRAGEQP